MSFKENLLKKIEIDSLAAKIVPTIGSYDSGRKIDKAAVRKLLAFCDYSYVQKRGMDLFLAPGFDQRGKVLVLDNELALYSTTIEDVLLRKNPFIKEMISIRNVIKILNDKDVVLNKKEATIQTLQRESIDLLDLSYTETDIDEIAGDGAAAFEREYAEGVIEAITLFAELLGYEPPPKTFRVKHCTIFGRSKPIKGGTEYGPVSIYNRIHHFLLLIEEPFNILEKKNVEYLRSAANGKENADREGTDVIAFLRQEVLHRGSNTG